MKKHLQRAQTRFLKAASLLAGVILAIICGSCGNKGVAVPAYGMPTADFKIYGTVRAVSNGAPLSGIQICLYHRNDSLYPILHPVSTDSLGSYSFEFGGLPDTFKLHAAGADSAAASRYADIDTLFLITGSSLTGGNGNGYLGHAEKQVNLNLAEKQPPLNITDIPQHPRL